MKKSLLYFIVVLFLGQGCVSSKKPNNNSQDRVVLWYDQKTWLNGLKLQPHGSVNKEEFAHQYTANKDLWDKSFEFLKTHDLENLVPGDYPIAGDSAYVKVTETVNKDFDQTQWESHKKYIDIQYVSKGKEKIGVMPISKATIKDPYNVSNDAVHYTGEGTYFIAEPGIFFIFFPQDAHRPGIKVNGDKVKKVVIKVRSIQ